MVPHDATATARVMVWPAPRVGSLIGTIGPNFLSPTPQRASSSTVRSLQLDRLGGMEVSWQHAQHLVMVPNSTEVLWYCGTVVL
jgi:hypothetical protein